jgi:nucleoside-diphosphate-sugar epimerase
MDYKIEACIKSSVYFDIKEIISADINWKRFKNKTVLITGAGGFIGYYLTLAFLVRNDIFNDNIQVAALVRNREKAEKKYGDILKRNDIELCVQDVTNPIKAKQADFIIHAASQASNIQFENDPVGTINANLSGTANVLDFAKNSNSESVLIVSSLKVYGDIYKGNVPINENDLGYIDFTSYKNCYAMGKRASETLAVSYAKQYGMNIKIARPSYIYGASSLEDDRVWAQFIANVVKSENILLKSNGAANRSFCYVSDTVTALLVILLEGENTVPYNISYEKSDTTIRGFAQAACQAFPERNINLSFANKEDENYDVSQLSAFSTSPEILDSTKLKKLGWKPVVPLIEGIKRSVKILEEK